MKTVVFILSVIFLGGCATHSAMLSKPLAHNAKTQKTVEKSFDSAWKEMVSGLSKSFFVINNIEKESGIINVSYSSDDPYEFIDCGVLNSTVDGKTTAIDLSQDQTYPWPYRQGVYTFAGKARRDVSLSGRVNIYLEKKGDSSTEINVNAKYVVSAVEQFFSNTGVALNRVKNDTTFQTGTTGSMQNIVCRSTGQLEKQILSFVE